MKTKNLILALIIAVAITACTTVDNSEQAPAGSTPLQSADQAAENNPPATSEPVTATRAAADTPLPPAPTASPPAEPPTATTPPMNTAEPLSQTDTAQIYAAAIYQIYNVDHTFGEPPGFPLVYISTTTADGSMLDLPITPPQKLQPDLLSAIENELAGRPYELIWVASLDEVPQDDSSGQIAGGEGIYITLGSPYPQEDGTVQLPVFMLCGGLCALGKTYVLSHVDGAWQITGSTGIEIMA